MLKIPCILILLLSLLELMNSLLAPPSRMPTKRPTCTPSNTPSRSNAPSKKPSGIPTRAPSFVPSRKPSSIPTRTPSNMPSRSNIPSRKPSCLPTQAPSIVPSRVPSKIPTRVPSSSIPTYVPTRVPTRQPSKTPSNMPASATIQSTNVTLTACSTPAQPCFYTQYNIGNIVVKDIWVDPLLGNDINDGSTRSRALQSIAAAWLLIPSSVELSIGYRIQLVAGTYDQTLLPNYWENKWGTELHPMILNSVDGLHSAVLTGNLNMFGLKYMYILGVAMKPNSDAIHLEKCSYFLLRNADLDGGDRFSQTASAADDTFKANQCDHIYIEDSSLYGARYNALQFVAVQYGHIRGSHLYNSSDWCIYTKGGSAYIDISSNEIDHCDNGGYLAGQGTGMEFMQYPFLHYEAYGSTVTNNIIHHTMGAGMGVNGAYNVMMAHNTLFQVGAISHTIEFYRGSRGCDGYTAQCAIYNTQGGWGALAPEDQYIPNKHIFVVNNVIYNIPPFQSQWSHFSVHGPVTPPVGSNVPSPAVADDDIRILGNIIWNSPSNVAFDLGFDAGACTSANPTCNQALVVAQNAINTIEPTLTSDGNYRPIAGGSILNFVGTFALPSLSWADTPATPQHIPAGVEQVVVKYTRAGVLRNKNAPAVAGAC